MNDERNYTVAVVATMSSGKTTLINAMVGFPLLPTSLEACTATVFRVEDYDLEQGFEASCVVDGKRGEWQPAEQGLMEKWNNEGASEVCLRGNLPFIENMPGKARVVLFDTPGPNNSMNNSHAQITRDVIRRADFCNLICVINASTAQTTDEKALLTLVYEELQKLTAEGRVIHPYFVLNKIDVLSEKEDVGDYVDKAGNYLRGIGFEDPLIIPACAKLSLLTRCFMRNPSKLSRHELRELGDEMMDFQATREKILAALGCTPKAWSVYQRLQNQFIPMGDQEIAVGKEKLAQKKLFQADLLSGIPVIETLMQENLQQLAYALARPGALPNAAAVPQTPPIVRHNTNPIELIATFRSKNLLELMQSLHTLSVKDLSAEKAEEEWRTVSAACRTALGNIFQALESKPAALSPMQIRRLRNVYQNRVESELAQIDRTFSQKALPQKLFSVVAAAVIGAALGGLWGAIIGGAGGVWFAKRRAGAKNKRSVQLAAEALQKLLVKVASGVLADIEKELRSGKPRIQVFVTGQRGAGKTVLMNALAGKELLPHGNEGTHVSLMSISQEGDAENFTAQRFAENGLALEADNRQQATSELLNDWNKDARTSRIEIHGKFAFPVPENVSLVVSETKTADPVLKGLENSSALVFVLMDAVRPDALGEDPSFDLISHALQAQSAQENGNRLVFLLNRIDQCIPRDVQETGYVTKRIAQARNCLERKGIADPQIIPGSALLAKQIRISRGNPDALSRREQRLLRNTIEDFVQEPEMNMLDYVKIDSATLERLRERLEKAQSDAERAEIRSGIPVIEELIQNHLNWIAEEEAREHLAEISAADEQT